MPRKAGNSFQEFAPFEANDLEEISGMFLFPEAEAVTPGMFRDACLGEWEMPEGLKFGNF